VTTPGAHQPGSGGEESWEVPAPAGSVPAPTESPEAAGLSEITAADTAAAGEPAGAGGTAAAGVGGPAEAEPAADGRHDGGQGPGEQGPAVSLQASLEAILLVADEPVPEVVLAQVLERPRHEIAATLRRLAVSYRQEGRGFELRQVAGGWRYYTREDCAPVVERFVRDGQEVRLTQAALETLAVVAYRQPVSRARVSAVRGVNCDSVMRTLTLRGLVEEAGTDRETGAILYRTTGYFLERLGIASLDQLPDLAPFLPDDIEEPEETRDERPGS
jgi:segregation and condensation protein B